MDGNNVMGTDLEFLSCLYVKHVVEFGRYGAGICSAVIGE